MEQIKKSSARYRDNSMTSFYKFGTPSSISILLKKSKQQNYIFSLAAEKEIKRFLLTTKVVDYAMFGSIKDRITSSRPY